MDDKEQHMAVELGRNIMDAISDLEGLVSDAKQPSLFGQGKKIVDEQEFYALIDDMRQLIPREIQVAQQRTQEAEQALFVANIQADKLISEAQTRAVEIGSQQEVMRLAKEQAEDTRRVALSEANTIRAQADTYASKTRTKANQDASAIMNNAMRNANETLRKANSEAAATLRNARAEATSTISTARRQASDLMVSVDEVLVNAQQALLSSRNEAQHLMETRVSALDDPISFADDFDEDDGIPALDEA